MSRLQAPLARLPFPQGFPRACLPQVLSSVLSWALSDLKSSWGACTMAQVTHLGSYDKQRLSEPWQEGALLAPGTNGLDARLTP